MGTNSKNPPKKHIEELVRLAQAGDQTAFEALYQEYFPKISRFISLRVSHPETAEDLTAEVFVKIWEKIRKESVIGSFRAWIFTIARNHIIDHYRTKKSFSDLFELENFLGYEDRAIEAINLDFDTRLFLQALDHLAPDQQQVIRLKFFEDLNNEEISAIMNKPTGTVRVIQHRAINALKKLLNSKKPQNK